ncbi:prion protein a [Anguilla anguilla]|uniref:prion protein a n=1 Tax=Anguilla anguilla TaxID=7936 RepID=UPI0015A86078|nr:prion protein a [Anguilla anguilla]
MIGQRGLPALWACLLLVATLCPSTVAGRGRGFGGRMGGMRMGARAPPIQTHRSSNTGMKMAGAAAAGALGGAVVGHGLSSMGRPGYGYGGYGGYGHGGYGGYPRYGGGYASGGRRYENGGEFRNETDGEYYYDSSPSHDTSAFVILGSMISFMMGHWMGI